MKSKIAIISDWFSPLMGYSENHFPVALARLDYEVYLITSDLQIYATSPIYKEVYQNYLGPKKVDTGISTNNQVTIIRLNSNILSSGIRLEGLECLLQIIKPNYIHCFEVQSLSTHQVVRELPRLRASLFCESRLHTSVIKPVRADVSRQSFRQLLTRSLPNSTYNNTREAIKASKKILPIAVDVKENLELMYDIPSYKWEHWSLGYCSKQFNKRLSPQVISEYRNSLGFRPDDIVCVYTGRLTADKGPIILLEALSLLSKRGFKSYKGLFVGDGDIELIDRINSISNCMRIGFSSQNTLPLIYQASDIGVWPLQESTSQIDAAASGIPIIVSNKVQDSFRHQSNGLTYEESNISSLADALLKLNNREIRKSMGDIGSAKMQSRYSWDALAMRYSQILET